MYDAFGVQHGLISKAKTKPLSGDSAAALNRLWGHYRGKPAHVGTPAANPNYNANAAPNTPEAAQFEAPKVDWGKNPYSKKAVKARRKKAGTTTTQTTTRTKGKTGQGYDLSWKNPYVKGAVGAGVAAGGGALGYAAMSDRQR
jgi:hypothetical protein